jgi:stalled ribosome rescue protein Dom34
MTATYHVIVWIDHRLAHIYNVTRDDISELATIRAPDEGRGHIHHKAGSAGPGHVAAAPAFLKAVAEALATAQEILIVGPADTKMALKKYIDLQMPLVGKRIKGVEPMKRASSEEIHDFATLYFRQSDLMSPSER